MRVIGSKKGIGPLTPQFIVLYIVAAVLTLVFYLMITAYASQSMPKLVYANPLDLERDRMADAIVSLPAWDGYCGCLAKTVENSGKVIAFPGLVPTWKLDNMSANCGGDRYRKDDQDICVSATAELYGGKGIYWTAEVTDLETGGNWTIRDEPADYRYKSMATPRYIAIEYPAEPTGLTGNYQPFEDVAPVKVHSGKIVFTMYW